MSSVTLTLTPVYALGTLELQNDQDDCRVVINRPTDELVLELTPIVGGGGSSVSGPDIYAFAAAYG